MLRGLGLLLLMVGSSALATEPVAEWVFVPEYVLDEQARNTPGPRIPHPRGDYPLVDVESRPIRFKGSLPTERLLHLLPLNELPRDSFTLEMWICHHVNRPVHCIMAARGADPSIDVPWTFGFGDWETIFRMQTAAGPDVQLHSKLEPYKGYKERWVHQVVSYDGRDLILYVNGQQVATSHLPRQDLEWPEGAELEMAAYMRHEPLMQWANLVHVVRIYDVALAREQVTGSFAKLCQAVDDGKLFPDLFHFTAGPYLNYATTRSISLTVETDRESTACLQWGTTAELSEKKLATESRRLHDFSIEQLQPNTAYFYRVTATSPQGESIDSGLLTFKTAVEPGSPFRFAVIGDTEARPHINDQLAKLVWSERPHFVVNLGDLTDAGKKPHRYEWTHEYFVGMTQLASRIPVFAVPGNGEDDLFWYNHYHNYPEPEGFYSFTYGDASFFMLDSNRRKDQFAPGGLQYRWLDAQLKDCRSKWKFVCHHHATLTSEEDDYGNSWKESSHYGDPLVQQIVPLYEKHGIDLVMFGHLHLFERSHPVREGKVDLENGVVHLLAGGGGGNLEDFAPTPAFFSAKTYRGHHYLTIEIVGDSLNMRTYDLHGNLKDIFTLTKAETMRDQDTGP